MLTLGKNGHRTVSKALSLTITLTVLFFLIPGAFAGDFSAGPLFDQFPLTLENGDRTEIMGPLFYKEQTDSGDTLAFPPLFSRQNWPAINTSEYDFLYPVFTYVKYGTQYRVQLGQLISFSGGESPGSSERRFTLFPIYFRQRSTDTNDNYTAVFPFYGNINGRLFRDKIFFVMFPAYSKTTKRDVVNYNYFYPFYNVRYGDGMRGWQFWPIVGAEHKVVTTVTNHWGEVQTIGGHDQSFILWPIHFRQDNNIGTDNPEKIRITLPFYSWMRSPNRDATSVIWPFFTWVDDREKKYREWQMPWPFIVVAHGEGKTAFRIFPFYQHAYNDTFQDNFYLWPVYKYKAIHSPPLDHQRTRILLFLFQNIVDKNTDTGKEEQRMDLWPFFLYKRNLDGSQRLQIFAFAESFVPASPKFERNWSPLWSIWRWENNPTTGADSKSFLWNLYRRDATPETKNISFLFGLYQYQSSPDTKKVRVFYIPVINRHPYHLSLQ